VKPDEEDFDDRDFWEHGVGAPEEVSKKASPEELRAAIGQWAIAFNALEVKFLKRALFAHDLRAAYVKKRSALKEAIQQTSTSKAAASVSEKKAAAAVSLIHEKAAVTT